MAFFSWTSSVGAGATFNPLEVSGNTWKYNRAPYAGLVEVIHNATATGVVVAITAGSDEIMQESPVSGGGTAGTLVGRLTVEPVTFMVNAGDVIRVVYRNPTAGAITVNGTIELTRKA
jgi:hypothetical protein